MSRYDELVRIYLQAKDEYENDGKICRDWGLCSNGTETWEVHATHPGHRDPGADAVHPAPQTLATRTSTVLGS